MKHKIKHIISLVLFLACTYRIACSQGDPGLTLPVFMIPNFHPASCGWMTDFSTERIYCANTYFSHMDKVNEDPNYNFVISEVNTMIAMLNFQPERFNELKRRIKEGRIEPVNGMFLELTPNLCGGEAIVRAGVNGIRWQEKMFGIRPKYSWMIDVTGMHEQMAQIGAGLGFKAQIYCRNNISGNLYHWAESPDGTRILTISGGRYSNFYWRPLGKAEHLLPDSVIIRNADFIKKNIVLNDIQLPIRVPEWSPYLILFGSGDYSMPLKFPSEFLQQWNRLYPNSELKLTTFSEYFDHVKTKAKSRETDIPIVKGGWTYSWNAFWVEDEKVKQLYRKNEHLLQATEMLSTIGSLNNRIIYPSQDLYHAWLQLHLNTDRNSLWGAAVGEVFESDNSWDCNDRYNWISSKSDELSREILGGGGNLYLSWFNPTNWNRKDPQMITLPEGKTLKEYETQKIGDSVLFMPEMSSTCMHSTRIVNGHSPEAEKIALPTIIRNKFYEISINPVTGELEKIIMRKSGKEIINQSSNYIIAEQHPEKKKLYHFVPVRNERVMTASTRNKKADIEVQEGSIATVIKITTGLFRDSDVSKTIKIYKESPRIDFDLYLEDIPDRTIVSAEFPLAMEISNIRRGIPFGMAIGDWPSATSENCSFMKGIVPAIRWSDYQLSNNAGFAILDRGVPGREHEGNSPRIMLLLSSDEYYEFDGGWLSGKGLHHLQYALIGYDTPQMKNEISRMAWEYNASPIFQQTDKSLKDTPFISTSENIIMHSLRREGDELELRFAECRGKAGTASFDIKLPFKEARITNLLGEGDEILSKETNFSMPVNPQQIVTVRFKTDKPVPAATHLTDWTPLVPEAKRAFLNKYDKTLVGHPPHPPH